MWNMKKLRASLWTSIRLDFAIGILPAVVWAGNKVTKHYKLSSAKRQKGRSDSLE